MKKLWQRCISAHALWADEDRLLENEIYTSNLHRLRLIVYVITPLIALHVIFFWSGGKGDSEQVRIWRQAIGGVHFAFASWWLLIGCLGIRAERLESNSALVRSLNFATPLGAVLFSAGYAIIDQLVTPNISPYLTGCILSSLMLHMRLRTVVLVQALGFLLFSVGIGYTQIDAAHLLTNRTNGLVAALASVLLAWMLWRKDASSMLLRRQLEIKNHELQLQQRELLRLTRHDSLTDLYNRREMLRRTEEEINRARRQNHTTSAIMLDLDCFKRVNDTYGHPAGDAVLRQAAKVILRCVRSTDSVGRIGGEEYLILLPDTSLLSAAALAERLAANMRTHEMHLPAGRTIFVTTSIGVSAIPADAARSADWLYAATDRALYEAKNAGRDRVHVDHGID